MEYSGTKTHTQRNETRKKSIVHFRHGTVTLLQKMERMQTDGKQRDQQLLQKTR